MGRVDPPEPQSVAASCIRQRTYNARVTYVAALFLAAVAALVFYARRQLASMQAAVLGGSILPGCVTAQALALLAIAILIALAHVAGWV